MAQPEANQLPPPFTRNRDRGHGRTRRGPGVRQHGEQEDHEGGGLEGDEREDEVPGLHPEGMETGDTAATAGDGGMMGGLSLL